jgi:hypothetical protein
MPGNPTLAQPMTEKPRSLPDFERRSVALFAALARGGKPGQPIKPTRKHSDEPLPSANAKRREPTRRHEPSVEPAPRAFDPFDRGQDSGSISSANFDESLK